MNNPLLWLPTLDLSQHPSDDPWLVRMGQRFVNRSAGRGHIIVAPAAVPACSALPSLGTTAPVSGARAWISPCHGDVGSLTADLETEVPGDPAAWEAVFRGEANLMLRRPPGMTLHALSYAFAEAVEPLSARLWVEGTSWGFAACYWVLSLHPEWGLYGALDLADALALAEALHRPLWVTDFARGPLPVDPLPEFAPNPRARPRWRHEPAPAAWL